MVVHTLEGGMVACLLDELGRERALGSGGLARFHQSNRRSLRVRDRIGPAFTIFAHLESHWN